MKKIITLLFSITLLCSMSFSAKSQCSYTLDMFDSFGDGWNGASVDVFINGAFYANYTVAATTNTQVFPANNGDLVEIFFNSGTWDSEITYTLTEAGAGMICSEGPSPTIGLGCSHTCGGGAGGGCSGGGGGAMCANVEPFCTDNTYCFTAGTGTTAEVGNDYGCLFSQPNPSWYYFEISTSGNLIFDMSATSDIDFAVWGPYPNVSAASSACGSLPAPIDCSFSASNTEQSNISGVVAGEVYILVVTNFAGVVQDISINTAAGNTATTNCAIVNCGADAGGW